MQVFEPGVAGAGCSINEKHTVAINANGTTGRTQALSSQLPCPGNRVLSYRVPHQYLVLEVKRRDID